MAGLGARVEKAAPGRWGPVRPVGSGGVLGKEVGDFAHHRMGGPREYGRGQKIMGFVIGRKTTQRERRE